MQGLVRIWILRVDGEQPPAAPRELERELPGDGARDAEPAQLSAVLSAPGSAARVRGLARVLGLELLEDPRLAEAGDPTLLLDELAARFEGREILLAVPGVRAAALIARVLGTDPDQARSRYELEPDARAALEWPVPGDPGARPALIGMHLDWTPPRPKGPRPRFPGGPGTAPTK